MTVEIPLQIDLAKTEYAALRAEIVLCLGQRITIISLGLTALAVLVGAGIAALKDSSSYLLPAGIFICVIPTTSAFVLMIYLNETKRIRRASHYLWGLEITLNGLIGHDAMGWETRVRSPGVGMNSRFVYQWSVLYFIGMAGLSAVFGVYIVQTSVVADKSMVWLGAGYLAIAAATFFGGRWTSRYTSSLISRFNQRPAFTASY